MEGRVTIGGVDAVVLLTESVMDGVFDREDSWALASTDSTSNVYSVEHARPATRHAWLLDRAYEISELHPSGRRLVLRSFDAGMTRAEEAAVDDHLAEDRRAARSGDTVAFLHDRTGPRRVTGRDLPPPQRVVDLAPLLLFFGEAELFAAGGIRPGGLRG